MWLGRREVTGRGRGRRKKTKLEKKKCCFASDGRVEIICQDKQFRVSQTLFVLGNILNTVEPTFLIFPIRN